MTSDPTSAQSEQSVVVVVPCYNEAGRLDAGRFERYAAGAPGVRFLFVNDGSTDGTGALLDGLREWDAATFDVLHLRENGGKGEAVRRGVLAALDGGARHVAFWDADLATPLEALTDFMRVLSDRPELEMVFGARVQLLGRRIERRARRHYLGRVFATVVSLMLRLRIYDTQCGAKVFRATSDLRRLLADPFLSRWVFDVELLARLIRIRRGTSRPQAEAVIYEMALMEWRDVKGSKVKAADFVRAAADVAAIWWRYLRPGAAWRPVAAPAGPVSGAAAEQRVTHGS